MKDGKEQEEPQVEGTSTLEWIVAGLGALLLTATIGYLVFQGVTQQDGPPSISFETGPVERTGSGYVVTFVARNEGHSTASALEISGRLVQGETVLEESRATIDHLPEQSARRGGLFFSRDPASFEFRLSAEGYSSP
jgi:uncharacterized protein (TIGR02588 family)